jgi:hypothetical protein
MDRERPGRFGCIQTRLAQGYLIDGGLRCGYRLTEVGVVIPRSGPRPRTDSCKTGGSGVLPPESLAVWRSAGSRAARTECREQ